MDSGVTNPLSIELEGDNVTYSLNMGINTSTHKAEMSYGLTTSGSYIGMPIKLIGSTSNPLELTDLGMGVNTLSLNIDSDVLEVNQDNELTVKEMVGCDSITGGTSGLVPAPSAGDEDKFLKADGTWDTVGGGSTYTAGTGIDITNDTISIDTSVVAQLTDIPDTSDMATQTWVGNQGYLTSSDLSGYATETWVGQQGYALASSLATVATSGDYGDLLNKPTIPTNYVTTNTNQTSSATILTGNKQWGGTHYFTANKLIVQNADHSSNVGYFDVDANNNFIIKTASGNRNINLTPNGTGTLQYNGSEVAKKSDIPDVSQLQEKLTAGDGVSIDAVTFNPINGLSYYNTNEGLYTTNTSSKTLGVCIDNDSGNQAIVSASCRNAYSYAQNGTEFWSCGYVDIPFEMNKTYTQPATYGHLVDWQSCPTFGKIVNGEFIPILQCNDDGSYGYYWVSTTDTLSYGGDSGLSKIYQSRTKVEGTGRNQGYTSITGSGIISTVQIIDNDTSITIKYCDNTEGYEKWLTTSDSTLMQRLREINIVRITPLHGWTESDYGYLGGIGKYNYTGTLIGTTLQDLGTNEVDFNQVVNQVISCDNTIQRVSNLVTSVDSSSTNSQYPSAKLFYDTVGDIETLINAL